MTAVVTPQIAPGYQKTEMGVLPSQWDVVEVGRLNPFVTSGSRGWARFYSETGAPFIRITNLSRNSIYLDLENLKFVRLPPLASAEAARTGVRDGDLLISITADIGIIGFVDASVSKPAYMNQHIALIRFDHARVSSRFVAYFLASERPQKVFVASMDVGAKAGMNLTTIRKIRLALPALPEQHAIAVALSDVDQLINAMETLIAKMRAIKQAAMHQLLSGKTRLPGFSGDWATTSVGRIGSTYGGLSGKSKADFGSGDARYVTFLNVLENVILDIERFDRVRVAPGESQNSVLKGDLLFNGTSETPGDLAMGAVMYEQVDNLFLNSFCFGFRIHDHDEYDPLFLAYFFRGPTGRAMMYALAQGATRYNMSKAQFLRLHLSVPTYNEQNAIATVLSDKDAAIAALERRRDKIRAIKHGMMQQLLSGRVRLIKPSEVAASD
jgi:type I restriction enzyme S subunit